MAAPGARSAGERRRADRGDGVAGRWIPHGWADLVALPSRRRAAHTGTTRTAAAAAGRNQLPARGAGRSQRPVAGGLGTAVARLRALGSLRGGTPEGSRHVGSYQ